MAVSFVSATSSAPGAFAAPLSSLPGASASSAPAAPSAAGVSAASARFVPGAPVPSAPGFSAPAAPGEPPSDGRVPCDSAPGGAVPGEPAARGTAPGRAASRGRVPAGRTPFASPPADPAPPDSAPPDPAFTGPGDPVRAFADVPRVTELRLSAFAGHRRAVFPLGPLTLLAGPSGCGKTSALRAYEALARLCGGAELGTVFPDPAACVPERARPDAQHRRGFRIGCTVDGPAGPVRLDVAVQVEPELRIVGERLAAEGRVLLQTALLDPGRRAVQAAWHTTGPAAVTRAPLPDDRLGTPLLPLRVADRTDGQRRVLAAAEQTVIALRSAVACDPRPDRMRAPVPTGSGRLLGGCDNLADALWGVRTERGPRHARFVAAVRAGCAGPVADVLAEPVVGGVVRALLDRGDGVRTGLARLGYGELRHLALAFVLSAGPGGIPGDPAGEMPGTTLTVLADGLDRGLDPRQRTELLRLAAEMCATGGLRLVGTVPDAAWTQGTPGLTVVHLDP